MKFSFPIIIELFNLDRMKYVYLHTNLLYKRVPIKSIQFVKFLTSGIIHIM